MLGGEASAYAPTLPTPSGMGEVGSSGEITVGEIMAHVSGCEEAHTMRATNPARRHERHGATLDRAYMRHRHALRDLLTRFAEQERDRGVLAP